MIVVPDDATPDEINQIVGPATNGGSSGAGFSPVQQTQGSKPTPQGFFSSASDASGLSMFGHALLHPVDSAATVLDAGRRVLAPGQNPNMSYNPNPIISGLGKIIDNTKSELGGAKEAIHQGDYGAAASHAIQSIPILGGVLQRAVEQNDDGSDNQGYLHNLKHLVTNPGAMGTLVGGAAGLTFPVAKGLDSAGLAPAVRGAASLLPDGVAAAVNTLPSKIAAMPRRLLAGDVNAPMDLTGMTPAQRYANAKGIGVQLDAANATNSGPLKLVKKLNENSLLGSSTYEAAKASNVGAVHSAMGDLLTNAYSGDPESGGAAIQRALIDDQGRLRTNAETAFRSLDDATGGAPIPGASQVGNTAQEILAKEQPFYTKYPTFQPTTAMRALQDLSKVGDTSSYAELQRLRSNVHELTTTNPDLVKDQSTGWLQRMTGTLDDAITDRGLTPDQTNLFREGNANWAEMKGTYDNPSNPLYQAVRSNAPTKLFAGDGLGSKTPEVVRDLKPRLGDSIGALQRGTLEGALKPTADGVPNYQNFPLQLNRIPEPYRAELFNPEQQQGLKMITSSIQGLGKDFNPSGSGKLLQHVGEFQGLTSAPLTLGLTGHPLAAAASMVEPLMQYPIAKLMNSPRVVDWLMKDGRVGGADLPPTLTAPPLSPSLGPSHKLSTIAAQASPVKVELPELRSAIASPATLVGSPAERTLGDRLQGLDGASTQLYTPSGSMPAKYRAIEADSLVPSHNAVNFKPNPLYPEGVQERDYATQKENQLRVIQNAQNYKPDLTITDNPDGVNGPPVVTPDGIVLGGNSRTMSTQRLYSQDGSAYKSALMAKAPSFGLDPEAISAMKRPILVREVAGDGGTDQLRRLGSELNKSMTGALGGSERAVSMGKNISPTTLQSVQAMIDELGGDASLREVLSQPAKSNAFLQKMQADGIITPAERPQFVDTGTGGMTEDGKRLFERALLGSAMGDSGLMDAAPKNILAKLNSSIGPISSLAARTDEWNILPVLRHAIEEHAKMASTGMGVEDYLNQKGLFGGVPSSQEETMTRALAQGPNAVREAFASYAKDARQSPEGQSSFLGPNAADSFQHAFAAKK